MVAVCSKVKHEANSTGIRPSFAIVVYNDDRNGHTVCATRHQVRKDNTLSLGRVISAMQITKVFAGLNTGQSSLSNQILPEFILVDSPDRLVWYKRRFIGEMWFRVGQKPECFVVEWTPLLFMADKERNSLRVFALGTNSRPNPETRLYHAPLMNINDFGDLCQGSAELPAEISVATIGACEASLIESQFTHVNHDRTLRRATSNAQHVEFWRNKSRTGVSNPQRVRSKELCPAGRLADLLEDF